MPSSPIQDEVRLTELPDGGAELPKVLQPSCGDVPPPKWYFVALLPLSHLISSHPGQLYHWELPIYSLVFHKSVGILNGFDANTVLVLPGLYLHLQPGKFCGRHLANKVHPFSVHVGSQAAVVCLR